MACTTDIFFYLVLNTHDTVYILVILSFGIRSRSSHENKYLGITESSCLPIVSCEEAIMFGRDCWATKHQANNCRSSLNPLTAKLFNLNFHPLEVVSRWRDPQLQVSENHSDLTKWTSTLFKSCWLMSNFIFCVVIKNENPNICGTGY